MEKTPKRNPTPKQRKAARAIVENLSKDKPLPTGQVLENVGYNKIIQDPKRIIESTGFKLALAELGLTEELITTALVEDIKEKPQNRIQELKLGAEVLGMVRRDEEPPKSQSQTTYNFIFNAETQASVKEFEEKLKARLINPNVQENKEAVGIVKKRPASSKSPRKSNA